MVPPLLCHANVVDVQVGSVVYRKWGGERGERGERRGERGRRERGEERGERGEGREERGKRDVNTNINTHRPLINIQNNNR